MQIVIDIPEETYQDVVKNGFIYDEDSEVISHAIINGTPLQDLYDLEGLKSDMKALNCGYPYGLDYLLNCLNNRLGITIIEADTESEDKR